MRNYIHLLGLTGSLLLAGGGMAMAHNPALGLTCMSVGTVGLGLLVSLLLAQLPNPTLTMDGAYHMRLAHLMTALTRLFQEQRVDASSRLFIRVGPNIRQAGTIFAAQYEGGRALFITDEVNDASIDSDTGAPLSATDSATGVTPGGDV